MNNFMKWQRSKSEIKEAKSWLSNKQKIDSQNNEYYKLIVREPHKELYQFCGQAYSGANNYHEMPDCLLPFIAESLKKNFDLIVGDALSAMEDSASKNKAVVEQELKQALAEIQGDTHEQ